MTVIELDELGPPLELPLTAEEGRALASSGVVSAVPSPYRPGGWLVGAAGKVGAARIGPVKVFIRPKVEIARLLFLLGYAGHGGAWQPDTVRVADAADLIPVIAQALWRQTERAIHQGLLPGYAVVEESSQVLRGRLRESAQLHAHHGLPLPLEIRHDEFTADIPENQLLAYCTILGLPAGHLVYARGNASPARHVIRQSGIEILCHAIDLSQPLEQLIGQMSNLAELITTMATTSCRYPV